MRNIIIIGNKPKKYQIDIEIDPERKISVVHRVPIICKTTFSVCCVRIQKKRDAL